MGGIFDAIAYYNRKSHRHFDSLVVELFCRSEEKHLTYIHSMIRIEEDDIRRIAGQLDALYTALKCFVYYTEVKNKLDIEKDNVQCWDFIEFTLMYYNADKLE